MARALLVKELRETWWMGLLALIAASCFVIDAMGLGFDHEWRITTWERAVGVR